MTDITFTGKLVPARVEYSDPRAYRIARRNGELILQGAFSWSEGNSYGHNWRDIPIVDLDFQENADD